MNTKNTKKPTKNIDPSYPFVLSQLRDKRTGWPASASRQGLGQVQGQPKNEEGPHMEFLIFGMVLATVGIAAAALGGIFAIYASRQD